MADVTQIGTCVFLVGFATGAIHAAQSPTETPHLSLESCAKAGLAAESYQAVVYRRELDGVPSLEARGPLVTSVTLGAHHLEDFRKPLLDTLPKRTIADTFSLGVSTTLISGTSLSAEVTHTKSALDFERDPSASFFETKGSLTLSQSLWKNSFGSATRLGLRASEHLEQAAREATIEAEENWFLALVELYYKAWLAQSGERTARENVSRRERLSLLTRDKIARGIGEEPDLLQVESALLKSRAQGSRAAQSLTERRDELGTYIREALSEQGQLTLDAPLERALELCASTAPTSHSSTRRISRQTQGIRLKAEQAENSLRPALDLKGSIFGNGVSDLRGQTFDQTLRRDHPGWSLGLQLTVPLFDDPRQAEAQSARAELIQAEALSSLSQRHLSRLWKNGCGDLARWRESTRQLETAYQNQKRRAELEEKRFRLARVATLNVIQAGDDLAQSETEWHQAEVESRLAAWKVRKLAGDLVPYLSGLKGAR